VVGTEHAPVVDVHTHYVPRQWPSLADQVGGVGWPYVRIDSEREAMIMVEEREYRRIGRECWDAECRLADMDADGVDKQVLSPTPLFFAYRRPVDHGVKAAAVFNDLALEICAPAPDRLVPFCQVPLQDPDAACRELDRCLTNGHVGVEIGNHIEDRDLDDEGIVTFLQHCAAVQAPVFVHPWGMDRSPRLNRWMARWLAAMPAETHLSLLAMTLGGVFDRVPESLRICFAHGGGSFAFWLGRTDNAWHRRPDLVATSEHPPSHYVRRVHVDSVVFTEAALRVLVDTFGVDRVMLGSDYPFPLGERPAGEVIRTSGFLTDEDRGELLGGTAGRFLART
jgi:aminocarboxymuconate-semialdehyde decarboxylase